MHELNTQWKSLELDQVRVLKPDQKMIMKIFIRNFGPWIQSKVVFFPSYFHSIFSSIYGPQQGHSLSP